MNPTITFPPPGPTLKLVRPSAEKWAATLEEERRRLQEDHEALREREANLREYEARLRALQAEIEAGRVTSPAIAHGATSHQGGGSRAPGLFQRPSSRAPFVDDTALHTAWEKLHRAHELFEAEQMHLRDDRIAIRDQEAAVKRREEEVTAREQRVAQREALITAATTGVAPGDGAMSTMTKITRAPFSMARSVFGGKK